MTEFIKDMNIIAQLDDSPALSASELKAKFDEGGKAIKDYLNLTVKTEIEGQAADIEDAQEDIEDLETALSLKQKAILTGTTSPDASLGEDGDIYIQY